MSGGVDSSVAAGLLKEQGYDVVGVTMCFNIPARGSRRPSCCGLEGIEDAKKVALTLGIPHYVLNFAKDLNDDIIEDFVSEYLQGRTPNPCVRCNRFLKFGTLFSKIQKLGGEYLATGHYVKLEYNSSKNLFELKKGADRQKDQSYFLYGIKKEILPRLLFPLGDLTKTEVRVLAKKFGLKNADKPGSQDICFIPDGNYKKFLEDHVGKKIFQPGFFKNKDGKVLGKHKGLAYYTIGQRDGLGLALGKPVYVYHMDPKSNTIFVGDGEELCSQGLMAQDVNFLSIDSSEKSLRAKVKIRYNHVEVTASIIPLSEKHAKVLFDEPIKSVTPGQSVVFYDKDVVLGGGIIEEPVNH